MTELTLTSLDEAANHLLNTLFKGQTVTLSFSVEDVASGAVTRMLTAVQTAATTRRINVTLTRLGERRLRLDRADI